MKTRLYSKNAAQGEQKTMLESKALGLEKAFVQKRARLFEKLKDENQRERR